MIVVVVFQHLQILHATNASVRCTDCIDGIFCTFWQEFFSSCRIMLVGCKLSCVACS